jgi:MFS family permease
MEAPPVSVAATLSRQSRWWVTAAAFAGLLFDGFELGLMPVASLSVSRDLLGSGYTAALGGEWFANYTAALMFGAACGGILLGHLGDRFGRTRALGISILFYSCFAGLGAYVQTSGQMLVLRFLVGLGIGGVWPNGIALVAECWPKASRPFISGIMSTGIGFGVLLLSQVARLWPVTVDAWRWLFKLSGAPALLGVLVLVAVRESPLWLAQKTLVKGSAKPAAPLAELFRAPLLRITLTGIALGSIPLIGAWAAGKWMMPWADKIGGADAPGYKAVVQGWWALGTVLGSFFGAQIAGWLGRRLSYFVFSIGATLATCAMFLYTVPLQPGFLPMVFAQGFIATLFFGWLPLYLPELFPTRVRATGSGIAYNTGRFATAVGVFFSGTLFATMGGDYARVGAICGLIYAAGIIVILLVPDSRSNLD